MNLDEYYPDPVNLVGSTTVGAVLADSMLRVAEQAVVLSRTHSENADELLAAAALTNGVIAISYARETAGAALELGDTHIHGVNCIPDDCRHDRYFAMAVSTLGSAEELLIEVDELELGLRYRTRFVPLDPRQVAKMAKVLRPSVRLDEMQRITDKGYVNRQAADWTEEERFAHALTVEYLAMSDMRDIRDDDPELQQPVAIEDLERYRNFIEKGHAETERLRELAIPVIRRCQERMPTDMSSTLRKNDEIRAWLERSNKSLGTAESGILISKKAREKLTIIDPILDQGRGEELQKAVEHRILDPDAGESLSILISFVHKGRRTIKLIQEPYPVDFPVHQIRFHIHQVWELVHDENRVGDLPQCAIDLAHLDIETASKRLDMGLHYIGKEAIERVLDGARNRGASHATLTEIVEMLTERDQEVVAAILEDYGRQWRKTATMEQATSIVEHARRAGVDERVLVRIAQAMGYGQTELGISPWGLTTETMTDLRAVAKEAGIPEPRWAAVESWIGE